jgi:hypothetical protein
MTGPRWNGKAFLLILSALACIAVAIGFAYPTPVANPALGAGWQCHRSVGIMTTCHRVVHAVPTNHHPKMQIADTRRA